MMQMYSREVALAISSELIEHLKQGIHDTHRQREWSERNFALLREFATKHGAEAYPSVRNAPPEIKSEQFLWDFIAYQPSKGILLAAESEHDEKEAEILKDFEKLLYVRSPVKLMMCRVSDPTNGEQNANKIRDSVQEFMKKTCVWYTPGEVYIIYCVYWAGAKGENRDYAFRLQINGPLEYASLTSERFEAVYGLSANVAS